MKKEIADKWTKALRSGEYKQGAGALKRDDCYCCLGVLCDISGLGEWDNRARSSEQASYRIMGMLRVLGAFDMVQEWAGLISPNGVAKNKHEESSLVYKNDKENLSFSQIADYIDANYQNL